MYCLYVLSLVNYDVVLSIVRKIMTTRTGYYLRSPENSALLARGRAAGSLGVSRAGVRQVGQGWGRLVRVHGMSW
jgi:hypothetical protein